MSTNSEADPVVTPPHRSPTILTLPAGRSIGNYPASYELLRLV